MASDFSQLQRLFQVMAERQNASSDKSYTAQLLAKDIAEVAQKFGEESTELIVEAVQNHKANMISESADVLYHLLALWLKAGISPEEVMQELEKRQSQSGLQEKASRS